MCYILTCIDYFVNGTLSNNDLNSNLSFKEKATLLSVSDLKGQL